jgi:MFS family permease
MLFVPGKNVLVFGLVFAMLWFVLGGWLAIAPAATATLFGSRNYSKNYGVVFTAYGVGAVLGVMVSGKVKDIFGSYIFVFWVTLIMAAVGITVMALTINEKKSEVENGTAEGSNFIYKEEAESGKKRINV